MGNLVQDSVPTPRPTHAVGVAARPRVLSGVAATGQLHIGNYIGAISVWAGGQDDFENYLFIADLHALTDPDTVVPEELSRRRYETAALYIACGIDPARAVIFLQSDVPAHAELNWILACTTPVGWLDRMTQFKIKRQGQASASAGLYTYPVLQAADILLYDAAYVPVGDDQRQHVELTRDVAQRFNRLFGETFVVPEPFIRSSGARIMGFDDPTAKMSKSVAEVRDGHAVRLLDDADTIRRVIMRAVTDSGSEVDPERASPGIENLLVLAHVLSGRERGEVDRDFRGQRYSVLKSAVVDLLVETISVIQGRYRELIDDPNYIRGVLAEGAERAAAVANAKVAEAKRKVGLD